MPSNLSFAASTFGAAPPPRPRSLASIHEGERLVVQRILFDAVRARCDAAGIAEGDVVVGRGRQGARVDLESPDGRRVQLDRAWADFIQVAPIHERQASDPPLS